jgi:hypothetical protein
MSHISDNIRAFFEDFNHANNAFAPDLLALHVSDPLVGADPNGVTQIIAKQDYLAGVAESQEYLESLGFQFVNVVPVEEIPLSAHYTLVKTKRTMRLQKSTGQAIDLAHDAAYLLFITDEKPRIVFVLPHEDPMKMALDQHSVSYEGQHSWDQTLKGTIPLV